MIRRRRVDQNAGLKIRTDIIEEQEQEEEQR